GAVRLWVGRSVRRSAGEFGGEVTDVAAGPPPRLGEWWWPGNVRELQSVLKQAILNATGTVLLPAFLPDLSSSANVAEKSGARSELDLETFIRQQFSPSASDVYAEIHRAVDRMILSVALEYTNGNHRRAARILGISRQTMRTRFKTLGLQIVHSLTASEVE